MIDSWLLCSQAGGGDAQQPGAEQPAGEPVLEDLARRQEEAAGTHAFQDETRAAKPISYRSVVPVAYSFVRRCSTCMRLLCFFNTLSVQVLLCLRSPPNPKGKKQR